jgi:hypothetical protein
MEKLADAVRRAEAPPRCSHARSVPARSARAESSAARARRVIFFWVSLAAMAETIACLVRGKVELLDGQGQGQAKRPMPSPHRLQAGARGAGRDAAAIVSVTRGRIRGELYYAIGVPNGTALFAQTPGSAQEQQLFLGVDARIGEIDFSFGDEALACTVPGPRGTSAIGSLADDGKGVRTVTEGDVVDCTPRWAPGGRGEILYASAGVGRTKSGEWGGLSPFALHRLRFADNSVEVLTADAKYDYLSPLSISESLLYAIRRPYRAPLAPSPLAAIFRAFRPKTEQPGPTAARDPEERELVRITPRGVEGVAHGVLAFDVAANGDVVYATRSHLFRSYASGAPSAEPIATLEHVEQLVIC